MANKINLQQLAKTLAQKKNLSLKDSEAFLREFFDSIIQNVTADKLVKVKGLGSFKLIEVLDRESVNVNTGERIVIPGHSKLSFTPETALKELINKPFADFQTVVINEGTSIEEMERLPAPSPDLSPEPEEDEEKSKFVDPEPTPVQALVSTPEPESTPEPTPEPVLEQKEEPEQVDVPKSAPEPIVVPETKEEPKQPGDNKDGKWKKVLAWIFGILLLCVIGFVIWNKLAQRPATEPEQEEPQVEAPVEVVPEPEVEYAQVPDGEYKIVGTRKTYVMKPGDFITRIAIQEYGDKDFTQYIIVHNAFPDPDNVPVDMEIKLPELEKIE